jgi:hypothetical protein
MLRYSVPPGYRRSEPVRRPKLDVFTGVIDRILACDHRLAGIAHRRLCPERVLGG